MRLRSSFVRITILLSLLRFVVSEIPLMKSTRRIPCAVTLVLFMVCAPATDLVAQTPYGRDYFELRHGLSHCRRKFEQEKVGRVAFLGGSITASPGWRDQVCEDLQRRFPQTKFDFINAGIPSLGSTPGAFRFQRDVYSRGPVDLLFEEAAVNDDTNGFSDIEQVRGMEGIVRQARRLNPNIDIVLLHFADPGKLEQYNRGQVPAVIANHEQVARHYQIPSIDLAREVTERIRAGEFDWAKDFKDLHPSPFGHQLYAKSVGRLFDAAWAANQREPIQNQLPPPLDRFCYDRGWLVSPKEALESKTLMVTSGWKLDANWHPTDGKSTRPGFVDVPVLVADQPGATLTYQFSGTAVGLFVAAGPDTGAVEFRVDGGPWSTMDLFTRWSRSLHLPWAKILVPDLPPGEHRLELKNSDQADQKSSGHAVRIVYLLVN